MQNSTRPNKPELDATKVPTDIDIAWAAGIFEGEGHCRLAGKTKRGFMVQIVQKDPELLYRLRDWFGGSVSGIRKGGSCHSYDICGDRARIFISLIYGFMTARRKAQIDATYALNYLGDKSPIGLNTNQLRSIMVSYYADHRVMVEERKNQVRRDRYRKSSADPKWREKTNEYNRRARVLMTVEQRESSRKYQQEYYQHKKEQEKLKVLQFKKTA